MAHEAFYSVRSRQTIHVVIMMLISRAIFGYYPYLYASYPMRRFAAFPLSSPTPAPTPFPLTSFIMARHRASYEHPDDDEVNEIIGNGNLSEHYLALARDLDVMEAKVGWCFFFCVRPFNNQKKAKAAMSLHQSAG